MTSVCVVIPAYNAAPYIADTLASVEAQSYPDIDIVVVDDGSVDDTEAIVRGFGSVRYVKQRNAGVSAARNRGVAETSAPLIAFLDADDAWHRDKIAYQVRTLAAYPDCDLVRTRCQEVPFGGSGAPEASGLPPLTRFDLLASSILDPYFATSTVMVRRSAFERAGGFDTSLRFAEDVDFYLKVLADRPQVVLLETPLVFKRPVLGSLGDDSSAGYVKLIDVNRRFLDGRPDIATSLGRDVVQKVFRNLKVRLARSLRSEGRRLEAVRVVMSALQHGTNGEVLGMAVRVCLPTREEIRTRLGIG